MRALGAIKNREEGLPRASTNIQRFRGLLINGAPSTRGPTRRVAIEASMMTFVVRLTRDKTGRITGVVEQVKTGLKTRVEGLDAVGQTIGQMIASPGTGQAQNPLETGESR